MSLTQKELARLHANNPRTQTRLVMGGNKLAFANLPQEVQKSIKERLAEKDSVMKEALNKQIIPGLKIDGNEVGIHNIHKFEIKNVANQTKPIETKSKQTAKKKSKGKEK